MGKKGVLPKITCRKDKEVPFGLLVLGFAQQLGCLAAPNFFVIDSPSVAAVAVQRHFFFLPVLQGTRYIFSLAQSFLIILREERERLIYSDDRSEG